MIVLRPYQDALRVAVSQAFKAGHRRVLAVAPTGSGKTAVATDITLRSLARKFSPVWFLVHRKELMEQTAKAFAKNGIDVGFVASGYELDAWRQAQVCLIGSMPKRMPHLPAPKLIITDEAHHSCADSYTNILSRFPKTFGVGLSATPERLDSKGLGDHFDTMVLGPPMRWLIEQGFLADYRIFCPPSISTEGIHTVAGDYNKKELEVALRKSTIMGDAIREYEKHARGKRAIVRALSREDSAEIAEAFKAAGHAAAHLDARNTTIERAQVFGDFQRGELPILCNVELFSEGVDVPGIEVVIDLRPTKSLTMYLQFVGRALRPAPGKEKALIIDHVGNVARHGLPDEEREWSLSGRVKRDKAPSIFSCVKCYAAFDRPFKVCPECGAENNRVSAGRGSPARVEGELEEMDVEKARKKPQFEAARRYTQTIDDLIAYGRTKGMTNPEGWARHVWEARQAKRGKGRAVA